VTYHCRVEKQVFRTPEAGGEATCLCYELDVRAAPAVGGELHEGRWFSGRLTFVIWNVDLERFDCRVEDEVPAADLVYDYSHDWLVENGLAEGWHRCL